MRFVVGRSSRTALPHRARALGRGVAPSLGRATGPESNRRRRRDGAHRGSRRAMRARRWAFESPTRACARTSPAWRAEALAWDFSPAGSQIPLVSVASARDIAGGPWRQSEMQAEKPWGSILQVFANLLANVW